MEYHIVMKMNKILHIITLMNINKALDKNYIHVYVYVCVHTHTEVVISAMVKNELNKKLKNNKDAEGRLAMNPEITQF